MKRWLMMLIPLVLAGCSLMGTSLPEGATQEDYKVCVSQADRAMRNHPSFKPSKALVGNELTVGLESIENGYPFCSVAGLSGNNLYFMYSSEKDVLLSDLNRSSNMGASRYRMSHTIDEAHAVCENDGTLESTDDYVLCHKKSASFNMQSIITLHDLGTGAWYREGYMGNQSAMNRAIGGVKTAYDKDQRFNKIKPV